MTGPADPATQAARRRAPLHALFCRYRTGEQHALPLLLARASPALRAAALRLGAQPDEADDLGQEAWIAALSDASRDGTEGADASSDAAARGRSQSNPAGWFHRL